MIIMYLLQNGSLCWLFGHVGNDARAAWKALKAEYQDRVQEVEELISTFQLRMDELQGKRQKLETLVSTLQKKVLGITYLCY